MSKQQLKSYGKCQSCSLYNIILTDLNKVRHHCHVTDDYISSLQMKVKKRSWANAADGVKYLISVVFHNLKGYDGHIIIKPFLVYKFQTTKDVNVIAMNMEM